MNETEDKMKLVTVSRKHYMLSVFFAFVLFCFRWLNVVFLLIVFSIFVFPEFVVVAPAAAAAAIFVFYFSISSASCSLTHSLAPLRANWMDVLECANKDPSRACKSHANSRNQSSKWFTCTIFILSIEPLQTLIFLTRIARSVSPSMRFYFRINEWTIFSLSLAKHFTRRFTSFRPVFSKRSPIPIVFFLFCFAVYVVLFFVDHCFNVKDKNELGA